VGQEDSEAQGLWGIEIVGHGDSGTQGHWDKYINLYIYQIVRKYYVK